MFSKEHVSRKGTPPWFLIERPSVRLYNPYYRLVKRTIDLMLCLILAPFAAFAAIFVGIAIRLDSEGPIFFIQERIGKGAKPFKIVKFRTLAHNLDTSGHEKYMADFINGTKKPQNGVFNPVSDSQVTRIGRILRKTSLDELPQLINVYLGDMSFVGPRPNVTWEVEKYRGWHQERLEVLPGITGLAQVRGRSGIIFDEIVEYDIEYIAKQGLLLDLKIMWWTIKSVLAGKGTN
ncbi:MAG: sugar transferase [Chloroflexota bacterium]